LAGPVSTRFLAGYGADVLRIDPPFWSEPGNVPEVVLGKRCAYLDLRERGQLQQLKTLLSQADVLVHGYRADALERRGLGVAERQRIRPGLIDVCLNAYGWTGPWSHRRGFDSLVQMSSGIAHTGMRAFGRQRPTPLPVQALDHATGYLMAAAVIRGLERRLATGAGSFTRLSLARTAALLVSHSAMGPAQDLAPETADDLASEVEETHWGPARRVRPPCEIADATMRWDYPANPLGSSAARWG
jgi:crotonobetainyl-CoA:carnitine CoA-transferase CaiB-like acyl-CoA transferase